MLHRLRHVVLGRDFQAVAKPGSQATVPSSTSSSLPANPGSTPGVTAPPTVPGKSQVGCG